MEGGGGGVKNGRFCSQRIRAEIVHLVERPTENPGATLTWVRIPGAARIFFQESTFSADSLTVSVLPPSVIVCISICAHVKNPKH